MISQRKRAQRRRDTASALSNYKAHMIRFKPTVMITHDYNNPFAHGMSVFFIYKC
jgi:hypothetical protein